MMPNGEEIKVTESLWDAPIHDDEITYVFSSYFNNPEHLAILTLESVTMGKLTLTREQVLAWMGKDVVARLEADHTPNRTLAQMGRDYEAGNYGEEDAA